MTQFKAELLQMKHVAVMSQTLTHPPQAISSHSVKHWLGVCEAGCCHQQSEKPFQQKIEKCPCPLCHWTVQFLRGCSGAGKGWAQHPGQRRSPDDLHYHQCISYIMTHLNTTTATLLLYVRLLLFFPICTYGKGLPLLLLLLDMNLISCGRGRCPPFLSLLLLD